MRFGKTLRSSVYPPWKDQYLDYAQLKSLLREDGTREDDRPWTEDDEARFCEEILNVQLEKVAAFQESTLKKLEQRVAKVGEKLRDLAPEEGKSKSDITTSRFKEIEEQLDLITNETNELKKYSNINYTGFLKIVKKHDRKRGNRYKVRPMLQISLAKRPFNSEHVYTPLVNKLSMIYFIVRQNLDETADLQASTSSNAPSQTVNGEKYTAYKFWVHPENLLEVKTYILRRLPVLVYSQQAAKQAETSQGDPTITSLYFDGAQFPLYTKKVNGKVDASSLRLRWYGQLNEKPDIVLEKKFMHENGSSEESRFPIKEKYIQPFINGEYQMEKTIQKFERQGQPENKVTDFRQAASDIQDFILKNDLQPVLRANYVRTAFQKPLDDRVRISIDTKLAFIREDSLDADRPCRNPDDWHRADIDRTEMEFPFSNINQGEVSRFPFAILEIKVKEEANKKTPQWIKDLMASHLVHRAPKFSKFIHGVASLFEDHVNSLPFWLSEVETDIRKDPQTAFDEEEQAKAQKAEDDQIVGSFIGTPRTKGQSYKPAVSSPVGKSYLSDRMAIEASAKSRAMSDSRANGKGKSISSQATEGHEEGSNVNSGFGTLSSVFPSFSLSRYAQSRRQKNIQLPPGVTKPGQLIKDSGPLHVEPKVWLANERTFLKWQHICILLGSLAIGLYTAAGEGTVGEFMGIAYISIAVFAGAWGYFMHYTRRNMIVARSGKDFDNFFGPIVISVALMAALIINFFFKYHEAIGRFGSEAVANATLSDEGYQWAELR